MVGGRIIYLGGHQAVDSHLIALTNSFEGRGIRLLVVPPHVDQAIGCRVMTLAARPGNRDAPTELLAAARRAAYAAREGILPG